MYCVLLFYCYSLSIRFSHKYCSNFLFLKKNSGEMVLYLETVWGELDVAGWCRYKGAIRGKTGDYNRIIGEEVGKRATYG